MNDKRFWITKILNENNYKHILFLKDLKTIILWTADILNNSMNWSAYELLYIKFKIKVNTDSNGSLI